MQEIEITQEPVELYKILKFESIVSSGGEAKAVIDDGQVLVNGLVETRKRPNSSPKCDTLQFKRLASFLQKPWLAA